jgi:hypothetical protein
MKNNLFLVLVFAFLSGCSTVEPQRIQPVQPIDHTLQPVDCTLRANREQCTAVANLDKKTQKKIVKPAQQEQTDRRVQPTKVDNKKINDDKTKVKSEAPPLAPDNTVASKPDVIAQKETDGNKKETPFSVSMACVMNNMSKKDDGRSNVRAVAYELAVLCRQGGVQVNSIANASIPLVLKNRASKK